MTFLEDRDFSEVPLIPEYFEGKNIFVTGSTGFIGKVLIEKLLYSCPMLNKIYIMMRDKKGVKSEDRLAALYDIPCFDRLRKERPGVFESKVQIIAGDMGEDFLGMFNDDRALIVSTTNIIFHVAASVRFDDALEVAVRLNLIATKELVVLAKEMPNLESFVHVSTAFSNTLDCCIEEQIYPPAADWRNTIEICKNLDSQTLKSLTPKYLGEAPNTYVFTKQLAEYMLYEERGNLPIVICRPAIVSPTLKEPFPGWIDNFNGPIGLLVAGAKGVMQSHYVDVNHTLDIIPCDIVVKAIIAAAWTRGTKILKKTDDIPIYNNCNIKDGFFTYGEIKKYGYEVSNTLYVDNVIWNKEVQMTKNKIKHFIVVLLKQIIPAIIIDAILRATGRKPLLVKLQRRLIMINKAVERYTEKKWEFTNKNFLELNNLIKEQDLDEFFYSEKFDRKEYFVKFSMGVKKYLLKEKEEDVPKAKAHYKRVEIFETFLRMILFGCVLLLVVKCARRFNQTFVI